MAQGLKQILLFKTSLFQNYPVFNLLVYLPQSITVKQIKEQDAL